MELSNCIICNGTRLKQMPAYSRAFLVQCQDCGLVFGEKKPTAEELTAHYSNYPRYQSLSPITEKRYNEILDKFEPYRKNNNLIDLGCSNGLFLECAKKRGWNVYGTEYAQECIDSCAKNNITVFKSDNIVSILAMDIPQVIRLLNDLLENTQQLKLNNGRAP